MVLLHNALILYAWSIICILIFFLYRIALFFEQRLQKQRATHTRVIRSGLLLIPAILFSIAAVIQVFGIPSPATDTLINSLWLVGGVVLGGVSYILLKRMTGGRL